MEKYAVTQVEQTLEKFAQEGTKCKCGGTLEVRGNIVWCSKGGSSCLEKTTK